jgi:hypothetical protein
MIKKLLFIPVFILFAAHFMYSQHSQTLYYMDRLPQITTMNPAAQPECNFYLGLPGISGINLNIGNNSLNYEDIIFDSPVNDSLITFLHPDANVDDFLNNLKEDNNLFTELSANLLSFGFRAGESYIHFGIMEKSELYFSYPKDLASLLLKGNKQFAGTSAQFGNFAMTSNNYIEYSLGFSRKVFDNLSIGFKAKYLNGLASLRSEDFNLELYTSESGDSMSLSTDIELQATAPVTITTDSMGYVDEINDRDISVSDAFANPGFAFDIGAVYQPMDELTLSASLVDLGFISYGNFTHNYRIEGQYGFTGIDVSSQFDDSDTESNMGEELIDSLKESINMTYSEDAFFAPLGPKIYIGGRYHLTEKVDFGLLSRTRFFNGNVQQSFTLSANTRPIRGISLSASYSIMNGAYNNLGLGLALRLGPFQLYTMSDMFSAGMWPQKTQSFNMRFGLNFVIGCNKKGRILDDEPMLY